MPNGVFRDVHLIGDYAVKVPRADKPAEARLLNLWEHEVWTKWQPKFQWPHLCPVLWCAPDGGVLVMRRGTSDATIEEVDAMLGRYYPDVTCETKVEDWGHVDGQLVVFDYGPAGWTEAAIQVHRDYYASKSGPAIDTR